MGEAIESVGLAEGDVLADRFRLVRPLGHGGIAVVWLAEDTQLDGEPTACKVLRPEVIQQRETVSALKREVLLSRRLRHPHILPIYTFWDTPGVQFISMSFVSGHNLAERLNDQGSRFMLRDVLPWVSGVASALDYAHSEGILHLDVKPGNILVDDNDRVQLADFGIGQTIHGGDDHDEIGSTTKGTLYYMAPEQLTQGRPGTYTDLYGLASTTYHLLNGRPPFFEGDIAAQIQIKAPEPIPTANEAVNRVLLRALSKDPARRQATCHEFADALEAASTGATYTASGGTSHADTVAANAPTLVLGDYSVGSRRSRLGRLLVEKGYVSQHDLADALLTQRKTDEKLGEVLVKQGKITEAALAHVLGQQFQLPVVALGEVNIDLRTTHKVSRETCERWSALPVEKTAFGVRVAMADPLDMQALNQLELELGESIEPVVATNSDIREAISRVFANPSSLQS